MADLAWKPSECFDRPPPWGTASGTAVGEAFGEPSGRFGYLALTCWIEVGAHIGLDNCLTVRGGVGAGDDGGG